jgi:hypothetical protein
LSTKQVPFRSCASETADQMAEAMATTLLRRARRKTGLESWVGVGRWTALAFHHEYQYAED